MPNNTQKGARTMAVYEVIVGNVGTVYTGKSGREARLTFACYLDRSKSNRGRCAGESVTLLADGEAVSFYQGTLTAEE